MTPQEHRPAARTARGPVLRFTIVVVAAALVALSYFGGLRIAGAYHLANSREAFGRRRWNDALTEARAALRWTPRRPEAAALAFRTLLTLGRADEAGPYYADAAGALSGEERQVWAVQLMRSDRAADAERVLKSILRESPDDSAVLRKLAAAQMAQSHWADALSTAERLKRLPGQAVAGHTLEGSVRYSEGEYAAAVAEFREVLRLDPTLAAMPLEPQTLFWSRLTRALLALGHSAEARSHLTRALSAADDAELRELLGRTYDAEGDTAAAREAWLRARDLDPAAADPWLDLGRLALRTNQPAEAVSLLKEARRRSPESIDVLYNLSQAYRKLGRVAEADRLKREVDLLRRRNDGSRG